jgi:hypothetical protein
VSELKYLTVTELKQHLMKLNSICDESIGQEKALKTIKDTRSDIGGMLKTYAKYLFESKEKISLKESLANYISIKIKYIDSTYLAACMDINNYTVRYLAANLSYCRANIRALNKLVA